MSQEHPLTPARAAADRGLDLKGPIRTAGLGLALFATMAAALLAFGSSDPGDVFEGRLATEARSITVQHATGGVIGHLHIKKGAQVVAGQVLVSLATKALDAEIAALRVRADKAGQQLDRVRIETLAAGSRPGAAGADDTKALLADRLRRIEGENAEINARIARTEREIENAVIRAPFAGRVTAVMAGGEGTAITPGATIAQIEAKDAGLVIETRVPAARIAALVPGAALKLWPRHPSFAAVLPVEATLLRTEPGGSARDGRATVMRVAIDLAGGTVGGHADLVAGTAMRFAVTASERPLGEQMIGRIAALLFTSSRAEPLQGAP